MTHHSGKSQLKAPSLTEVSTGWVRKSPSIRNVVVMMVAVDLAMESWNYHDKKRNEKGPIVG